MPDSRSRRKVSLASASAALLATLGALYLLTPSAPQQDLPAVGSALGSESCLQLAKSEHAKLFDSVQFAEDLDNYGKVEFYASTWATLESTYGDCDDFSLYLYSALRRQGCPVENVQLVYYVSKSGQPSHVNLRVKANDGVGQGQALYFDVSRKDPFTAQEWHRISNDYKPVQLLDENNWVILEDTELLDAKQHPYFSEWQYTEEVQQGVEFRTEEDPSFWDVLQFKLSYLKDGLVRAFS